MPRTENTLRVQAPAGQIFPMEGQPRRHITDSAAVVVVSSPYYRRALRDGDLVEVPGKPPASPKPAVRGHTTTTKAQE